MSKSTEKVVTKAELEQHVRDLEAKLSCTSSDIGDWKIAKCMEYQVAGLDMPYDITELHEARQAVRDEINQIQEQITEMENAESDAE